MTSSSNGRVSTAWQNDVYLKSPDDIVISVFDFGFIHNDATYDVMRVQDGKIKFETPHLERFRASCSYYRLHFRSEISEIAKNLITTSGIQDGFIWMLSWRGRPPTGSPRDLEGFVHNAMYIKPYYALTPKPDVRLTVNQTNRRVGDESYNQNYKNFGWIEFTQAQFAAQDENFDASLLLDQNDCVTEGMGFGIVFIDASGHVCSPSRNRLGSITIGALETICGEMEIPFEYRDIKLDEIGDFREALVCSTSGGITPVSQIDKHQFVSSIGNRLKQAHDSRF